MKSFSVPKRLQNAVRYVMMIMRKKAAMKRLMDLNFHASTLSFYDRVLSGPLNHYQFSCSSTPVKRSKRSTWDWMRPLLGCINAKEMRRFSLSFPRLSIECSSPCSSDNNNESLCVEVDVEAEEFIAKFYEQMDLQRQDSYVKCQEMLARGT
ncbi:hypothetical protein SUGI_0945340 [Cryptomeria japonica]|uniref:uncharacterized protein LOC131046999 n=1 Tax=Cryptomeria japonica TaxID=3369 RepID=UPI0024149833|nr:uncharacterized protein LOC131046999 [Cryptomeria japonica]GLJ44903.1 hypothetical protein SUGI_0945340 [Cryptomeria japonica]